MSQVDIVKIDLTGIDMGKLTTRIDRISVLRGAGVAVIGEDETDVLRRSNHASGLETYVVVEEMTAPVSPVAHAEHSTWARVWKEFPMLALNCGGMALSGLAITGEAAAAPLTAGGTGVLAVLSTAGFVATTAQCGLSGRRMYNAYADPNANEALDSDENYKLLGTWLDRLALLGGLAALGQAGQALMRLQSVSGRSMLDIIKGMTRAERRRLAQDLARYASNAASHQELKAFMAAEKLAGTITQVKITSALKVQLYNAISTALGYTGSAVDGEVHNVIFAHIFQEDP